MIGTFCTPQCTKSRTHVCCFTPKFNFFLFKNKLMAGNQWGTGICDITAEAEVAEPGGLMLCMSASFCPCCVFGEVISRLDPEDMPCGGNAIGGACICYNCPGLCLLFSRMAVRKKYGIEGSLFRDVATVYCGLACCSLIQVSKSLLNFTSTILSLNVQMCFLGS